MIALVLGMLSAYAGGDSVLKVVGYVDGAANYAGTAFSIGYDKKTNTSTLISNEHICVDPGDPVLYGILSRNQSVTLTQVPHVSDLDRYHSMRLNVVKTNRDNDLCMLTVNEYVKPLKISKKEAKQGDRVMIIGNMLTKSPIFVETFVSGYLNRDSVMESMSDYGNDFIFVSEIMQSGISGAPVLKDGKVVGVMFASSERGIGFGISMPSYGGVAVSLADLKDFIDQD